MAKVSLVDKNRREVEVIGVAMTEDDVDRLIGLACRKYGCDWLGDNGFDFDIVYFR